MKESLKSGSEGITLLVLIITIVILLVITAVVIDLSIRWR